MRRLAGLDSGCGVLGRRLRRRAGQMEVVDAGVVDLAVGQVRRRQNKADGEAIRKLYTKLGSAELTQVLCSSLLRRTGYISLYLQPLRTLIASLKDLLG
jgi:hypothetical protein